MPWSNTWNFVDPSGITTRSRTRNSDGTFTEITTTVIEPPKAKGNIALCVTSAECASGFACINGQCQPQSTAGSTDGGSAGCGLEDNGDGGGGGGCAGGGCTEPGCDNTECDCDTSSTRTCRTDENGDIVCECVPDDEEGKPCSKFCTNQWLSFGVYRSPCTPVNTCSECYDCILAVGGDVPRCSRKASSPTLPCQCDQDLTGDANPSSTNLECKQCTNSGAYVNDPNCSFEVTCTRNCTCGPIEQTIPVPSTVLAQERQQYCLSRLRCPSIAEIDPDNCDPEGPIDETCDTANGDYVTSYDPAGPGNNIRIRCGAVWCNTKDCNCYTRISPDASGVYCTQWAGGILKIGKDEIVSDGIFFTAPGTISTNNSAVDLSIFKVGDTIVVSSDSGLNDGTYVVAVSSPGSLSVTAVGGGTAGIQTETAAAAGTVTIRRTFGTTTGNDISFPSSNVMKSASDRFCDLKAGDVINIKTTSGVNDGDYTVKSATCTEVVITGNRFTTQTAIEAGTVTVSKVGEIGVSTKDPTDGKTYCWKERRVGYPERTSDNCPKSGEENPDSKDSCDPTSDAYVCKNEQIQTVTSNGICPDEGTGSFPCPAGKQCIKDTCINNSVTSTYTMKVRICDADSGCPTAVECNCHADCADCQLCGGFGVGGGTCVQDPACLDAQKWVTFKLDYQVEVETVCCLNSCGCPAGTNPVSQLGNATYQYWVKQGYFDIAYNVSSTSFGVGYLNSTFYDNNCNTVLAKAVGLDGLTRALIFVSGDLDDQNSQDLLNKYAQVEHWLYGGSATRVISFYPASETLSSCEPAGNANCSRGPCGTLSSQEGGKRVTYSDIYDIEVVDANPGENPPSGQTTNGSWLS